MTRSRRLLRTWAILATLTAVSVAAALWRSDAGGSGPVAVTVALAVAFFKARQVLDHFLDLKAAPAGWRYFFSGLLLLILGGCLLAWVVIDRSAHLG